MRHLELIVEATATELSSALWYLKQRGLVASDDKSSLQITVDGMDFLESRKPLPEDVMAFIKHAAIVRRTSGAQARRRRVRNGDAESSIGADARLADLKQARSIY